MTKEIIREGLLRFFLFFIAIVVIVWAYYSNLIYNLDQGIDAFSGATQIYDK